MKVTAIQGNYTAQPPQQQPQEPAKQVQPVEQPPATVQDECDISYNAKEFERKQLEKMLEQQQENIAKQREFFENMLGKSDEDKEDSLAKSIREKIQCAKIAAQIRKGNFVKRQDEQFLLKKDPQLYMMATSLRKKNDNPKRCSRISEQEKNPNSIPGLEWLQNQTTAQSSNALSNAAVQTDANG